MGYKTGTITAAGQSVFADVANSNFVAFYFSGVHSGANVTFEISPDSTNGVNGTWFLASAARVDANTVATATGVLTTNGSTVWEIMTGGAKFVRARATALTSGQLTTHIFTGTVNVDPSPVVPTHPVSQSGTWLFSPAVGTSVNFVTAAASTNGAVDRTTAASLYEVTVSNPTATPAFLKFYNKATAPTVGTDVPVITIPIASNSFVSVPLGAIGKRFSAGIGRAVTANAAATDTTATVAGIQVNYTWLA